MLGRGWLRSALRLALVFVMIAGDEKVFQAEKFDHARCHFDAWAMCEKIETGQPLGTDNERASPARV